MNINQGDRMKLITAAALTTVALLTPASAQASRPCAGGSLAWSLETEWTGNARTSTGCVATVIWAGWTNTTDECAELRLVTYLPDAQVRYGTWRSTCGGAVELGRTLRGSRIGPEARHADPALRDATHAPVGGSMLS